VERAVEALFAFVLACRNLAAAASSQPLGGTVLPFVAAPFFGRAFTFVVGRDVEALFGFEVDF
jgi:hypothetical protein